MDDGLQCESTKNKVLRNNKLASELYFLLNVQK
jgi:hypothetical protein